jgi:hypothetical protein
VGLAWPAKRGGLSKELARRRDAQDDLERPPNRPANTLQCPLKEMRETTLRHPVGKISQRQATILIFREDSQIA